MCMCTHTHTHTHTLQVGQHRIRKIANFKKAYGGKTEFALMNHRHHDRNARVVMAPAVYLVLVNLMNGVEQCALELRWWRRFIKAGSPRGMAPTICLIGSRGDKAHKAQSLLNEIRHRADADGKELPEITAAFQFDCRGAAWPLRDWCVS